MNKLFYPRLAITNMKKNGRLYAPFGLAVTGAVMMFYILHSIYSNQHLYYRNRVLSGVVD